MVCRRTSPPWYFGYFHDGVADGATVDSLVYNFAVSRDRALGEKIRVVHLSPAFGIPPVVVNPDVRPQLKGELQALLFNLPNTPEGQEVLATMGVDGFVTIEDQQYDTVRELIDAVSPLMSK